MKPECAFNLANKDKKGKEIKTGTRNNVNLQPSIAEIIIYFKHLSEKVISVQSFGRKKEDGIKIHAENESVTRFNAMCLFMKAQDQN